MPNHRGNPELIAAYEAADLEQRIRMSRVGCWLALALVPLFGVLDILVYPDQFGSLMALRLVCGLAVLGVLILLGTGYGRRWIRVLGIAWALLPGLAISWMVYATEGVESPYYAGLNLVMITVVLLMPWSAVEVWLVCLLTFTMYIASCLLHPGSAGAEWAMLVTHCFFISATATICITAGIYASRQRFEEFRLRHELDQRNTQLAEMDRLKSEFYGNVSHELRTPLTLILAPLTRLIDRVWPDREVPAALNMMRSNALRLLRLINDILDIVRMDGGHIAIDRTRIALDTWIPGITTSIGHLAESKRIDIELLPPPHPVAIDADQMMMEKVLLNLLTNAIKFTPERGCITVSWDADQDKAWFAISDTGIGISAEEMPRLFRRFHQVDGSPTRQYRGLGLGLVLSRDLVERHGGRLTAVSTFGKGSTFTVELPLPKPTAEASPTPATVGPGQEDFIVVTYRDADRLGHDVGACDDRDLLGMVQEPEHASPLSDLVLVADDEPDMRRFLVKLLRERYRVVAVADGEQAVEAAHRLHPNLVILDMTMPKLDGIQACRAIRSDDQACDCRIVLLTARADDETKLGALQGGADDFLSKPFSCEEVLSRAHNLLENAALQRSLRDRNAELEAALVRVRETEIQLVQSEKMNAIGSLAAGLLHEINNPLNYAQVAVHLARENIPPDNTTLAEMLADAHDGMRRIGSVIGSLRSFAHPDHTDLAQPFSIDEAVDLALRFTSLKRQGLTVRRLTKPGLLACGSVNQVSMVLVNLVTNATRAIQDAGEIAIVSGLREGCARIEVKDTGVGMDTETARRAFEPFFTTSQPGQGMGLGLSICHTIVRNHRGNIGIDSVPGAGTTVWIELPSPAVEAATEHSHG